MRSTRNVIIWGLAGLGVVALGLGVWSFRRYARLGGASLPVSPLTVWFQNPRQGAKFEVGSTVLVEAQAGGPHPIQSMELWVNDQEVEVQGAPTSEGLSPFQTDFHWQPDEVGSYALFARATDTNGRTATSALLALEVVEADQVTLEELESAYAAPGPSAPSSFIGSGSGVGQPGDSGGPLPLPTPTPLPSVELVDWGEPSEPWSPTLAGWFSDLLFPDPHAPQAPGLPAIAEEGCTARLFIADNSDDEQGFYVYRRDPGMASFVHIATLAPYDGPVFTFEDPDLYGIYHYYVTSFNGFGESLASNIQAAEVTSSNCAPEPSLKIELVKLLTETLFDMGYCYYSLDGLNWFRHPAAPEGFLMPAADGVGLAGIGDLAHLADADGAAMLHLECWGWSAGELHMLGRWEWQQLGDGAGPSDSQPAFPGADVDLSIETELTIDPSDLQAIRPAYDFRIPVPYVWIGTGPQDCADFSNIPNPLVLGLICGDVADDLDFALWGFISVMGPELDCPGTPVVECFTLEDIIGYNVYDIRYGWEKTPEMTVDAPATLYFLVDEAGCYPRNLWVTALVKHEGEVLESFPSNQVYYPGNPECPYLLGKTPRQFLLTWETIDFSVGNIDDGVDVEDDAEGYGYLKLTAPSAYPRYWNLSEMGHGAAGADTQLEAAFDIEHSNVFEFEDDDGDNPYYWQNIPMSPGQEPCQLIVLVTQHMQSTQCPQQTGPKTVEFSLYRLEAAYVYVRLWDADPDHPDDPICHADSGPISATIVDDAGGTYHGTLFASHSSASCEVKYTVIEAP